ncbi:MAG: XdhC family protein [Candidatus Lindowbacteria bacterium]|nr:XdhC family protein [Candidatus Lindowbacteria bacterium]
MEILEEVLKLKREGRSSAIATIVQCVGSAPQKEGAKMLVRDDGTSMGTLGGGCIEARVIHTSMKVLSDGAPITVPFNLTEEEGGLVCGGKILVYIEPIIPEPHLVILGAGHVGKALSSLADFSGFRVTVVDDREEYANKQNLPHAHAAIVDDFESVFSRILVDKKSFIVIATRGHNHDLDALKSALKTEACYIGLVGSRRKRAVLLKTLGDEGFPDGDMQRVITPVGLAIGSITPEEIAISIMAQIIQRRRGKESAL